ncbi:MAG TPA: NAD(P)-binding domain-containing protein [Candidatus Saccharimonadales bacterium]|jgi:pyrroline-5-carboxylate reductase|nr:NAD(P)-binding domain-containing protein [Candidatus Saccharimonadales bacterium]
MEKVGIVGIGAMGSALLERLKKAGVESFTRAHFLLGRETPSVGAISV